MSGAGSGAAEAGAAFDSCIAAGGIVLFPADTVYGLAADPASRDAVTRIYELKGRPPERPAAVMFFSLESALAELPELGRRSRDALERLLPGPLTLLVPNPARRFPLACGPVPERLGVRVPVPAPQLAGATHRALQTSANPSGSPDARRIEDVAPAIRAGVDLELDGGELPGTPSTVVDLTRYEESGDFTILREGAMSAREVALAISAT